MGLFWKKEELDKMMMSLVSTLAHMQSVGLCHRDLKPANLFLMNNGSIKVIDFGDARKVHEGTEEEEEKDQPSGRRDTFVGTVNYQSPEVINSEEQGHPLDIWALGCILFKMFICITFKRYGL